ncbi:uncharacterized protein HMPREF1541_06458 [Cyphellophora europaea CBS 101466]|uniref:Uncharacterized protein n=1 Tax=Cyphellophora europaea (strain CBS 101466) TaxID=1220924 RepID=W2RRS5_CYPE1|nr:uncharacterized protein HMPREF1541_06458 [Cyphellophora europaea CBS 101466]ETN38423.1 hypothetical protein HMPREF1541_06458 [Cyphellophora europaea CBS 101466]
MALKKKREKAKQAELLQAAGIDSEEGTSSWDENDPDGPRAITTDEPAVAGPVERATFYPQPSRRSKHDELLEAAGLETRHQGYDPNVPDEPRAITTDEPDDTPRAVPTADGYVPAHRSGKKAEEVVENPAGTESGDIDEWVQRVLKALEEDAKPKSALEVWARKVWRAMKKDKVPKPTQVELEEALEPAVSNGMATEMYEDINEIVQAAAVRFAAVPSVAKQKVGFYQVEDEFKKLLKLRDKLAEVCRASDEEYLAENGEAAGAAGTKKKSKKPKPAPPFAKKPEGLEDIHVTMANGRVARASDDWLAAILHYVQELIRTEEKFRIYHAYFMGKLNTLDKFQRWQTQHRILSYLLARSVNMFAWGLIPKPPLP